MTETADRFRRLIELIGDALELPPADRDRFMVAECGDDQALLTEARALLAQQQHPDTSDPLHQRVARVLDNDAVRMLPRRIGPYELLEVLGEGGMGVVYAARQHEPIRREVAIKLLRSTFTTREAAARFRTEQQTLARLAHPHVAAIHDAGTTDDGQPYLVMELVRGEPITRFAASHRLGLDARLRLFAMVCAGVHHAHQKAVIHRDLKPSNILVREVDGTPLPTVIDFGIARVTDPDPDTVTAHTAQGMLLGTL
jgi:serine/threonine protein kinase